MTSLDVLVWLICLGVGLGVLGVGVFLLALCLDAVREMWR